jgi:hypothetical protein
MSTPLHFTSSLCKELFVTVDISQLNFQSFISVQGVNTPSVSARLDETDYQKSYLKPLFYIVSVLIQLG